MLSCRHAVQSVCLRRSLLPLSQSAGPKNALRISPYSPYSSFALRASTGMDQNEQAERVRTVDEQSPTLRTLVHDSLTKDVWNQTGRKAEYPKLGSDISADVVIVGAGVSGLLTALLLSKAGKKVVVLEARTVGAGNSGRHTGELTAWKRHQYSSLHQLYDAETIKQIAASYSAAVNLVVKVVKEFDIQCDAKRIPGYVFASGDDVKTTTEKELAATKDADISAVSLENHVDIGTDSDALGYALEFKDTVVLDPVRFINGLAKAVIESGGQIYEQSRVQKPSSSKCKTVDGYEAEARDAVVIATSTPITHDLVDSSVSALAVHGKHSPKRRYAIAMRLPKESEKEGVFIELEYPPRVVRITKDAEGLLLVASGEEHDQGIPADEFADYFLRLEAYVKSKWPTAGERTHQWSYQVFETTEHLGFHGKDPTPVPYKNIYISYGDSGETLTNAVLGGAIISDQILGRSNQFSELYSPSRQLRGVPGVPPISFTYVKNTVSAIANLVVPDLSQPKKEASELDTDSGAIIQSGVRKVALYKDDAGNKHAYSAICPHLGCQLQWNPVEKQWNCPCHGSCFDKLGSNLGGGPSTLDMTPLPGKLDW